MPSKSHTYQDKLVLQHLNHSQVCSGCGAVVIQQQTNGASTNDRDYYHTLKQWHNISVNHNILSQNMLMWSHKIIIFCGILMSYFYPIPHTLQYLIMDMNIIIYSSHLPYSSANTGVDPIFFYNRICFRQCKQTGKLRVWPNPSNQPHIRPRNIWPMLLKKVYLQDYKQ